MTMKTGVKHYLQFKDFSRAEYDYLFERTRWIKEQFKSYKRYWPLSDRTLVMIFEKASTRTRLSFEAGVQQLGGAAIYLNTRDSQLGRGEPVEDAAQVISRMSDVIMIRTFEQDIVERLAGHSRVPVINGLTDLSHPCQIVADLLTIVESGKALPGLELAWLGDGNNVLALIFGSKDVSRAVAAQAEQMSGIGQDIYKQMLPVIANTMMGGFFKQIAGQFQP